jgi:transketolase
VILGTFDAPDLTDAQVSKLRELALLARGDILKMTTLAGSGHPGGSMSSIDFELVLWGFANVDPKAPFSPGRDRIVISHGHTSPGAYAALARLGYFDVSLPLLGFRRGGSPFEGHVERDVPGIEWGTGNLGQGLSAAVGFAVAARLKAGETQSVSSGAAPGPSSRYPPDPLLPRVFCCMGDGEQQKGQAGEARRFAVRHSVTNLVALLDWNRMQLSGSNADIFPQDILADWRADGWDVLEVDGHDVRAVYRAVRGALRAERPTLVACHTVMSKGVPFMEKEGYKWQSSVSPTTSTTGSAIGRSPRRTGTRSSRAGPTRAPSSGPSGLRGAMRPTSGPTTGRRSARRSRTSATPPKPLASRWPSSTATFSSRPGRISSPRSTRESSSRGGSRNTTRPS